MDYPEQIAKRVLEAVLPDAKLTYQAEQSHSEYDFELRYADGKTAAVEITSSVDQALTETVSAIRGKRAGGSSLRGIKCTKSWIIFPAPSADIPRIRNSVDDLLSQLEQRGVENFSFTDRELWGHPICRELGVTSGAVIAGNTKTPSTIKIAYPVSGGAVGPTTATEAGEREAWKQDNRTKLSVAKSGERHIVVYVDGTNGQPWTALTEFDPPSALPNLPDEITHIWMIGQTAENSFVLWRGSKREMWRKQSLIC